MREKIVALIVCLIIFAVVLSFAISTAVRSSTRPAADKTPAAAEKIPTPAEQPTAEPIPQPEPLPALPPAPVKKHRFKSTDHPSYTADFDFSKRKVLPAALAKTPLKAGILVDLDTRQVIWEKNSNQGVPIASLTKLLTIYTAFEELERKNDIDLNTRVTVSTECTLTAPVKIKLRPGEKVRLHELFLYSMLKSANDAAHLIAEYFGNGDSNEFIKLMNRKASAINMTSAKFHNANGLPIYEKKTTDARMNIASCHDMVKLIERIYDYPMILRYTSCREKNSRHGNLRNGNQLLGKVKGMEGLKTGYTNAAGHCLAFSCRRGNRRLAGVVTGFSKRQNCFAFTAKLLEWGFKN